MNSLWNATAQKCSFPVLESDIRTDVVIVGGGLAGVIVAEVVECVEHPDSDHLHVCKVNVGDEVLQIVCGAPNVRKGLKVLVALPGCILPGDFEIKAGKIRGQESNGMICALYEIGIDKKSQIVTAYIG